MLGFPAVEAVFVVGALGVNFRPRQEFAEQSDAGIFKSFGGAFKAFEDMMRIRPTSCFWLAASCLWRASAGGVAAGESAR